MVRAMSEPSGVPLVTVIIPTYNRKDSLARTLDSLARQTCPDDCFEVMVVDDGGWDGTEEITRRAFPFTLHYQRQENQGEIVARNVGARRSKGEFLVFLDDDIEVNPDYAAALLAVHRRHDRAVVLGALVEITGGSLCSYEDPADLSTVDVTAKQRLEPEPITFIDCMSGILSIPRSGFFEIGAMQPLLATGGRNLWGGIDFGYRAHQHGFSFWRARGAVAYHHDDALAEFGARCRRNYRVSREVHHLFAKHPALQGEIPMFRDKGPIAWRADPPELIVRKLARQLVSSLPALSGMEYLVRVLESRYSSRAVPERLHRWIISGHIYRGYRAGLRDRVSGNAGMQSRGG